MRAKIKIEPLDDGRYLLNLSDPQRAAILTTLELLLSRSISAEALIVQTGANRTELQTLASRLSTDTGDRALSAMDIHVLHATLTSSLNQFADSEEDFYIRVGFFRENILDLARGLVHTMNELTQM